MTTLEQLKEALKVNQNLKIKLETVHNLINDYIDYRHMDNGDDETSYENLLDYWRSNIRAK